ncbi:MAG: hypothetical protein LUD68_02480 [Rikenellaceae bacterium]|nr:hypothetical protein [Rikenellaceae bacterium]
MDGIALTHPVYNTIYQEYCNIYAENPAHTPEEFPMNRFTDFPDAQVCNTVVDILIPQDDMKIHRFWSKHDLVIHSEEDVLNTAVPRALTLYKTKIVEQLIAGLTRELAGLEDPTDPRAEEILRQINRLNEVRKQMCSKFSRIIL